MADSIPDAKLRELIRILKPVQVEHSAEAAIRWQEARQSLTALSLPIAEECLYLRAVVESKEARIQELLTAMRADFEAGRAEVDKALAEHGYDSMHFADMRHGWLFSSWRIHEILKQDEQARGPKQPATASCEVTRVSGGAVGGTENAGTHAPDAGPAQSDAPQGSEATRSDPENPETARDPRRYATTDGKPPAPGMGGYDSPAPKPINPATGQHGAYWVLSDEERAKGFVRPVRRTYTHKKCRSATTMGQKLSETYAREPKFYGATFCCGCGGHFPVAEFLWDDGETVGS